MFAPGMRGKKITETEEGVAISENLLSHGYVSDEEIERFPGVTHKSGIHPVIECTQNIPCNPCQDACKMHCIKIGEHITQNGIDMQDSFSWHENLPYTYPHWVYDVGIYHIYNLGETCSGQAIFLLNEDCGDGTAEITMPYEFLPLPKIGDIGTALSRKGEPVCNAEIVSVKSIKAYDKTNLLTMKVPKEFAMKARFFRKEVLV